jgi:hypothetical protein
MPNLRNPYPYWLIITRTGRISCPPEMRHTPIEKLLKSGKIGGTQSSEVREFDKAMALARYNDAVNQGLDPEVYVVMARNRPRQRLRDPRHELASE